MLLLRKLFILLLFISIEFSQIIAANISGKISVDENWEPVIYLSLLNSFDELNTASYDFLIAASEIDSLGYFEIDSLEIPENNMIYRLHICKVGDPVSTIIIGGADENYIHFIMSNADNIVVKTNPVISDFKSCIVEGNDANRSLSALFDLRKSLLNPPTIPSMQTRKLVRDHVLENYKTLADTSSYTIIKLITLYMINESFKPKDELRFMEKIRANLPENDTSNPYYLDFIDELNYLKYQQKVTSSPRSLWYIWVGIALIIIVLIRIIVYLRKEKPEQLGNELIPLLNQLSIQEKRVLDLLKEGRSNKEIAEELHIEVSTVKSHLNKIYSRLGVKNRKEIVHYEW